MIKSALILLLLLNFGTVFGQDQLIDYSDVPKLNVIIKSLEKGYKNSKTTIYKSVPQTTASYFEIVTKSPENFIAELKKSENLRQLENKFLGLQIDRNVLIIKNVYIDYNNEKKIDIKSFEIENSQNHSISLKYNDTLNQKGLKHFYSSYKSVEEKFTTIRGFYLNDDFKSIDIPEVYSDWINYTDIIVKPETSVFYDNKEKSSGYKSYDKTIIDSLVSFYETATNKPPHTEEQELEIWHSNRQIYSDNLYKSNQDFKDLLQKSLSYAEENKVSNGDLEDFTAQLISKNRALELMRQNQKVGSCSFDNSPVTQQKRIAALAAQTYNWGVFIKSFLNVMNDNVSRIANSNIASDSRETYINELTKLDLDVDKVLLGSNFRIEDAINKHYFSDGNKIAKAYADLGFRHLQYFETVVRDVICDKSIDAFNKLHIYNTYKSLQYALTDSVEKKRVENKIKNLVPLLPDEIKSRVKNPNKQLCDLLYREKEELDKFIIKSSAIGTIYSYSYGGDCWKADLVDRGSTGKITYDLTMAIGEEVTPLKNFLNKKNELDSRVASHHFLQKILDRTRGSKLNIMFTNDRSFANHRNRVTNEMPLELNLKLNFNDAISLYISLPSRNDVHFILLNNDNLLVLEIPKSFELPGYKFEDLIINQKISEEKSFFTDTYKSFKLFDKQGEMLK